MTIVFKDLRDREYGRGIGAVDKVLIACGQSLRVCVVTVEVGCAVVKSLCS